MASVNVCWCFGGDEDSKTARDASLDSESHTRLTANCVVFVGAGYGSKKQLPVWEKHKLRLLTKNKSIRFNYCISITTYTVYLYVEAC